MCTVRRRSLCSKCFYYCFTLKIYISFITEMPFCLCLLISRKTNFLYEDLASTILDFASCLFLAISFLMHLALLITNVNLSLRPKEGHHPSMVIHVSSVLCCATLFSLSFFFGYISAFHTFNLNLFLPYSPFWQRFSADSLKIVCVCVISVSNCLESIWLPPSELWIFLMPRPLHHILVYLPYSIWFSLSWEMFVRSISMYSLIITAG